MWKVATDSREVKPYLPFPLEVREFIMKHILESGQIQVRQPDITRVDRQRALLNLCRNDPACPLAGQYLEEIDQARAPGPSSLPGYQILATCTQAYAAGVERFYTKNTFYLPPGHVEHSINYFNSLAPKTRAMIKKIGIRFTIEDLAPDLIPRTGLVLAGDKEWATAWKDGEPKLELSYICGKRIRQIWYEKLAWVREWETVGEARFEFPPLGKAIDIKGSDLRRCLADAELNPFKGPPEVDPSEEVEGFSPFFGDENWSGRYGTWFDDFGPILDMASDAAYQIESSIEDKINEEGWVKCREWIVTEQKTRLNLLE